MPDCEGLACSQRMPDIHEVVKWHFHLSLWVTFHEHNCSLTSKVLLSGAELSGIHIFEARKGLNIPLVLYQAIFGSGRWAIFISLCCGDL